MAKARRHETHTTEEPSGAVTLVNHKTGNTHDAKDVDTAHEIARDALHTDHYSIQDQDGKTIAAVYDGETVDTETGQPVSPSPADPAEGE